MKRTFRIVLDTNVFISIFLLRGRSSVLVPALLSRYIILLVSAPILKEYFEVSTRPKFGYSAQEIRQLLEGIRPYTELITSLKPLTMQLSDSHDLKFLECAIFGSADWVVSGDHDLLTLERIHHIPILTMMELAKRIGMYSEKT